MFLTTTEKLNATPEALARYQDLLLAEVAAVKKIRAKLEPVTSVEIKTLRQTTKVTDLLSLLRTHVVGITTLTLAKKLLDAVTRGDEPLVVLVTPMDHYTIKRHPLAEAFVIAPYDAD